MGYAVGVANGATTTRIKNMPKVHHVKKAQQRYATKPVIDEATGLQKQVPVMSKRTGDQKTSKNGRPVFLKITERDLERPLPMPQCDAPGCEDREIKVGMAYKWIEPSGQRVRNRHETCPTWNVWDYSSSLSARIAQIQSDEPEGESEDDFKDWANSKAEEIRELAEEKRESASNIEDGFGHATYQSDELNETADNLEQWADDLENVDIPSYPEPEGEDCEECDGTGDILSTVTSEMETCPACDGASEVTPDEPSEEEVADWEGEVIETIRGILDEAPC